ncbi:hypothetical protein BC936DRAFT_141171 [Jimgerdemannia flammicorona]|uniref:Uncharacterized protein n=2 Tax=Jimgerdemannia flammicorona TaxID=994334 RepID=A0A433DG77_9FUNG|nr:hypothetical protein BC936DRAFT_141171 [Jimgerdemannia flammicorona]RUS34735.1 hypothetical protein BC938DRAFT_478856 [Jimgerdemannia flammicorona]
MDHAIPPDDELLLRRRLENILTTQIFRENPPATSFACLRLVLTLITNILDHPGESNYHGVKTKNKRIHSELIVVPGGVDLIVELGFRRRVIEFEEKYMFEAANEVGFARLGVGRQELEASLRKAEERKLTAERMAQGEKDEKELRKKQVLIEIEEDRQRRKVRDERAKAARRNTGDSVDVEERGTDEKQVPLQTRY